MGVDFHTVVIAMGVGGRSHIRHQAFFALIGNDSAASFYWLPHLSQLWRFSDALLRPVRLGLSCVWGWSKLLEEAEPFRPAGLGGWDKNNRSESKILGSYAVVEKQNVSTRWKQQTSKMGQVLHLTSSVFWIARKRAPHCFDGYPVMDSLVGFKHHISRLRRCGLPYVRVIGVSASEGGCAFSDLPVWRDKNRMDWRAGAGNEGQLLSSRETERLDAV